MTVRRDLFRMMATIIALTAAGWPAAGQPAPPVRPAPAPSPGAPVFYVEVIHTGPVAPALVEKLRPVTTLAEVETLLTANDIGYAKRRGALSSEHLDPEVVALMERLAPREVFVIRRPNDQGLIIGVILGRR